jgi:hypothetical protein
VDIVADSGPIPLTVAIAGVDVLVVTSMISSLDSSTEKDQNPLMRFSTLRRNDWCGAGGGGGAVVAVNDDDEQNDGGSNGGFWVRFAAAAAAVAVVVVVVVPLVEALFLESVLVPVLLSLVLFVLYW